MGSSYNDFPMTKQQKKKAKKPKSPGHSNQKSLVWRIFHFGERFELPEDMRACRKSGLQYTKDFVSAAGGDEAVGYLNQFKLLDNGDGLELAMIKGVYRELVNLAAQHSKARRGYLIDAAGRPLTDTQIGKLLNIKGPTMRKILRQYDEVTLLEQVELPEFDMSLNDLPPRKKDGDRRSPEKSGKKQKPLKNGKRENENRKVNEQRATPGLSAGVAKDKENDKAHRRRSNAQGQNQSRAQAKDEPPSAPTTAPPFKPHESDDPGGSHVIPFTAPRTSIEPATGRQRPAAATAAGGYDRSDELFGTRIYLALGFGGDVESPRARREICSFASKWAQCRQKLTGLPPPVADELGNRLRDEAKKIARRGRRNTRPGAVWCTVADKLVTARLREAM